MRVSIRHDDLRGACIKGPADGRIDILSHELPEAKVLGMLGIHLVPGGHTGDAFHVCSDQDFHEFSSVESSGAAPGLPNYDFASLFSTRFPIMG